MPIDTTRQVACSSAAQGGASARVIPGAIGYPAAIADPDNLGNFRFSGGNYLMDLRAGETVVATLTAGVQDDYSAAGYNSFGSVSFSGGLLTATGTGVPALGIRVTDSRIGSLIAGDFTIEYWAELSAIDAPGNVDVVVTATDYLSNFPLVADSESIVPMVRAYMLQTGGTSAGENRLVMQTTAGGSEADVGNATETGGTAANLQHYAYVCDGTEFRRYINGVAQPDEEGIPTVRTGPGQPELATAAHCLLMIWNFLTISPDSATIRAGGFKLSKGAIYTGSSFTPPSPPS